MQMIKSPNLKNLMSLGKNSIVLLTNTTYIHLFLTSELFSFLDKVGEFFFLGELFFFGKWKFHYRGLEKESGRRKASE
jgi:hypothetical protein